jgi:hypothetical protein
MYSFFFLKEKARGLPFIKDERDKTLLQQLKPNRKRTKLPATHWQRGAKGIAPSRTNKQGKKQNRTLGG